MPLLSEYSPWPQLELSPGSLLPHGHPIAPALGPDLFVYRSQLLGLRKAALPLPRPQPRWRGGRSPTSAFPTVDRGLLSCSQEPGAGVGGGWDPHVGACPNPLSPSALGQILPLMGFSCGDGEVAQAEPSAAARTGDEGGTLRPFPHARGRNSRNPPRRRPRPFRPAQGRPLGSALGLVTPTAGNPGKWPRPGMPTAARLRSQQGWRAALSGLNPPPRVRSGLGSRLAPLRPR